MGPMGLLIDVEERFVLVMFLAPCQAYAIYSNEQSLDQAADETHALLCRLVTAGGAHMTYAGILSLEDGIFLGEMGLSSRGRTIPVDARPSDAVALSLCADAPIRVGQELLEEVGEDPEYFRDLMDAWHEGE